MASTTQRAKEVIAKLDQFEVDMHLANTWVHGADDLTVLLGGVSTPTIKNLVKNFRMSAQEILDAADYIQDNYEGLEDIIDANREYAEIAETLLLKIADWMARDLAEINRINIDRYNNWYKGEISFFTECGETARAFRQEMLDIVKDYDLSVSAHSLMQRLLKGTNPTSSTKPVLFVIAGQSNANGQGPQAPFDSAVDCGQFWSWADGSNELKPIVDPIGDQLTKSSGWCSFAKMFFALTGRKVILLNIAKSGSYVTSVADDHVANTWADDGYGTVRTTRKAIWDSFVQAVPASSYDLGAILWVQGEYDGDRLGNGKITVNDYIDGTLDVFDWLRGSDMLDSQDCPILLGQIGYRCSQSTSLLQIPSQAYKKIIDAQAGICDGETIFLGFSTAPYYWWSWKTYMGDGVHYGTYGYELQGKMFARSAAKVLGL